MLRIVMSPATHFVFHPRGIGVQMCANANATRGANLVDDAPLVQVDAHLQQPPPQIALLGVPALEVLHQRGGAGVQLILALEIRQVVVSVPARLFFWATSREGGGALCYGCAHMTPPPGVGRVRVLALADPAEFPLKMNKIRPPLRVLLGVLLGVNNTPPPNACQ